MVCGVHGPDGHHVVKRVDMANAIESDSVTIRSQPTMVHPASALDFRRVRATRTIVAVQVRNFQMSEKCQKFAQKGKNKYTMTFLRVYQGVCQVNQT